VDNLADSPIGVPRFDDSSDAAPVHDITDFERALEFFGVQHVATHHCRHAEIEHLDTELTFGERA
jgi:hypothetical protein